MAVILNCWTQEEGKFGWLLNGNNEHQQNNVGWMYNCKMNLKLVKTVCAMTENTY